MKKTLPGLSLSRSFAPFQAWPIFTLFLFSYTLLSYFPLSQGSKIWLGLGGLLLPFTLALLWGSKGSSPEPKEPSSSAIESPSNLWFLTIALVLFTRFYKLTALPFWPIGDEGILSTLAEHQAKDWSWDLLWAEDRQEPLGVWSLGLFFKIFDPSLFSIRLFPALVSLATCFAAYGAVRQFFPKSLSYIFFWLFSLSFWEFSLSRLCMRIVLLILFQCVCFWLLGLVTRSDRPKAKWRWLLVLGLWAGLGFYTFTSWAAIWVGLAILLAVKEFDPPRGEPAVLWGFFLVTGLLAFPLVLARLSPGGMAHIQEHFVGYFPGKIFSQYMVQTFWDGTKSFPFGSNWGGLFNPIFGSLILIGLLDSLRKYRRQTLLCFASVLFLSMLPALLTNGIEIHRMAAAWPFFTLLAALGAVKLASVKAPQNFWKVSLFLLAASLGLDLYNFAWRYSDIQYSPPGQQWRSVEYSQAYGLLKERFSKDDPVYLFSEFNTDYDNKTLNVAAYSIDGLQKPELSPKCQTAALLLHKDYTPFLKKEFAKAESYPLSGGPKDLVRSMDLILIPLSSLSPETLRDWKEADLVYRAVHRSMKNRNPISPWDSFAQPLLPLGSRFKEDHFLTSIFWEKIAFLNILAGDPGRAAEDYSNAIQQGYPSAHFYHNLGTALKLEGKKVEAEKAFRMEKQLEKKSF